MAFFVELPADKYGNRAYTNSFPCVVEANVTEDRNGRQRLELIAPAYVSGKWHSIFKDQYGGWLEVSGPARALTWEEREKLIEETRR